MLILYHAPNSRSTRIVQLAIELGALDQIEVRRVTIPRHDGTGSADPSNPHPEGKVPFLVHDGAPVWESIAIAQYLTDLFPENGLAPAPGDPDRGTYLSWLAYYAGVIEPVFAFQFAEVTSPMLSATFRGPQEMTARLATALEAGPYLTGDAYTTADLVISSPFVWFPDATPDVAPIRNWVARCSERPSIAATAAWEEAATA